MRRLPDYAMPLLRMFAAGDAINSWYNSMYTPGSGLYRVGMTQDGHALLWGLVIFGVAMMADVLFNDLTPEYVNIGKRRIRVLWPRAFKCRHLLFMGLACCYVAQPYVALRAGNDVSLTSYFYWKAAQCLVLAFFDAKLRSRGNGWQRAYS